MFAWFVFFVVAEFAIVKLIIIIYKIEYILFCIYFNIKALNHSNTEGYLNSKAVEVREPAKQIIEIMKKY
ncbi:MAG: hypothetical protein A2046_14700 [Bacteroidetes bacterium GWA2_30_7]|nr:MAG: hypothetical protein A2046_14700 [Bacteroidetes bacterium GWA2_30_7]